MPAYPGGRRNVGRHQNLVIVAPEHAVRHRGTRHHATAAAIPAWRACVAWRPRHANRTLRPGRSWRTGWTDRPRRTCRACRTLRPYRACHALLALRTLRSFRSARGAGRARPAGRSPFTEVTPLALRARRPGRARWACWPFRSFEAAGQCDGHHKQNGDRAFHRNPPSNSKTSPGEGYRRDARLATANLSPSIFPLYYTAPIRQSESLHEHQRRSARHRGQVCRE